MPKFCPKYGEWSEKGIPKSVQLSLILQSLKFTAFTVSKLLRDNQQEG